MFITRKHISRRTVLKGIGASIALPLLDAMNPAATAWAQTAASRTPKRLAFVGFPHGAVMGRWSPAESGVDYEMSSILEPLAPFREHMTIVSGLRNKPAETPEPHVHIEPTWLSCVAPWDFGVIGPGGRRYCRPDSGTAYRPGHAPAFARTHDLAGGSAIGLAHADTVPATGRKSARGVL